MCARMTLQLTVHLVNGRVYWALVGNAPTPGGKGILRGTIEEPLAALYHSPGTHLMEAAYEAYRALGD